MSARSPETLLDRIRFLAENPEVCAQSFNAEEAQAFMAERERHTPLREAFFAKITTDPCAHMMLELLGRAYADGYEQGTRAAVDVLDGHCQDFSAGAVSDAFYAKSHSDRVDEYIGRMTQIEERAASIIALADLAYLSSHRSPT